MIILDTNVVSEPLKPSPDQAVLQWLDAQDPQTLYLTAVNLAELLAGIEALPVGRRRAAIKVAAGKQIEKLFEGRIVAFDNKAAEVFARCNAGARAAGNRISFADCAIAAVASAHGFMVATRKVGDFKGAGVQILNPWSG